MQTDLEGTFKSLSSINYQINKKKNTQNTNDQPSRKDGKVTNISPVWLKLKRRSHIIKPIWLKLNINIIQKTKSNLLPNRLPPTTSDTILE